MAVFRWPSVMSTKAIFLMPSAVRRCATASPIPDAAPVTNATLRGVSVLRKKTDAYDLPVWWKIGHFHVFN